MFYKLSEHGLRDSLDINYEGKFSNKLFAGTITSRKKFRTPLEFRDELYKFLSEINYSYAIQGTMEYHEQEGRQDKVHAHVMLFCGNPPKGNKSNMFFFHVHKLDNKEGWSSYCKKHSVRTLETAMNIASGFYDLVMSRKAEGYCLFDD